MIVRRIGTGRSIHLDLANAWFPFTQPAWLLLLSATCALLAITSVLSVARPEPLWGQAWKKRRGVRRGGQICLLAMYLLNVYVCQAICVSGGTDVWIGNDRMPRKAGSQRVWRGGGGCRSVC